MDCATALNAIAHVLLVLEQKMRIAWVVWLNPLISINRQCTFLEGYFDSGINCQCSTSNHLIKNAKNFANFYFVTQMFSRPIKLIYIEQVVILYMFIITDVIYQYSRVIRCGAWLYKTGFEHLRDLTSHCILEIRLLEHVQNSYLINIFFIHRVNLVRWWRKVGSMNTYIINI
jgi:hypothetical protein